MTTVYITYSGDAADRFDRDYYRTQHLPLVTRCWSQYGLQNLTAFYPDGKDSGVVALCLCEFRDDSAVTASFSSPEAAQVMADVRHFTDITPVAKQICAGLCLDVLLGQLHT